MMNLHAVVRGSICAVHPEENVTLYRSTGASDSYGAPTPLYAEGKCLSAQVQSEGDEALYYSDNMGMNDVTRSVWLFADRNMAQRPAGIFRPLARGGDMLRRADGTWWLITAVPEDFSASGWVKARISLQTEAPAIAAEDNA